MQKLSKTIVLFLTTLRFSSPSLSFTFSDAKFSVSAEWIFLRIFSHHCCMFSSHSSSEQRRVAKSKLNIDCCIFPDSRSLSLTLKLRLSLCRKLKADEKHSPHVFEEREQNTQVKHLTKSEAARKGSVLKYQQTFLLFHSNIRLDTLRTCCIELIFLIFVFNA